MKSSRQLNKFNEGYKRLVIAIEAQAHQMYQTSRSTYYCSQRCSINLKMASSRSLLLIRTLRSYSSSSIAASHHRTHQTTHEYLEPCTFIGSWQTPKNPIEAEKQLAQLRRDYAKKVREVRKEYIQEMEIMRLDKQRKDEAKREAMKAANEERKKLKAEAAKVRAEERKVAEEEFRQTLLKERREKLENWRMKETKRKEKKAEKNEVLRRKSSLWVDSKELESSLLKGICQDITPL